MKTTALFACLAIPALTTPAFAQSVHVVDDDPGPGVDFRDIQEAIDAASDGDLVLVKDGDYTPFHVNAKGLQIVGEVGERVVVDASPGDMTTSLTNLGANQELFVRGLIFQPPATTVDASTLVIAGCAGDVWVEDVRLETVLALPFVYMFGQLEHLLVQDCDRVVLTSVEAPGLPGAPQGQGQETGSYGLRTVDSHVHLFDCTISGGSTQVMGDLGRPGTQVEGGLVSLSNSRSTGGQGGPEDVFGLVDPGQGGPGLRLDGGGLVWRIGSALVGGFGGGFPFGGGAQGVSFEVIAGTLTTATPPEVTLTTERVVRDNAMTSIEVLSEPGSQVFLLFKAAPVVVFSPLLPGAFGVGLNPVVLPLGTTDPTGALVFDTTVPAVPGAIDFYDAVFQVVVTTPGAEIGLSNPRSVAVVDAAF